MEVEFLDSTSSTMDEARDRVLSGRIRANSETVFCSCVMALEQTSGRGQRGRQWFARRGESLSATYILSCPLITDPARSHSIGLIAGVAVADVLERLCHGIQIRLKWPNDLLLNGKKAGGILVEMITSPGGERVALIGVGVNVSVREFPNDLAKIATSMLIEGLDIERLPDLKALAEEIGNAIVIHMYKSCADPAAHIRLWRQHDGTSGRKYQSIACNTTESGVAEGIDDSGALVLRLDNGARVTVTSATSLREVDVD